MIYIYDIVIEPYVTTIKRYGTVYKLENRTRMKNQVFYTFASPGEEKLLVVPYFAEQYRVVEKFYQKIKTCKKLETCLNHIKKELNNRTVVEEFQNGDSETGTMSVITVDYSDIQVQFEFMNHKLTLSPDFEIKSNNIFGKGIVVTMNLDMEEAL
jgi:hypothetical protein